MAAYQERLPELTELGITVAAATVDARDDVQAMGDELGVTFPLACGITEADVAAYAAEWADDHRGHYLQPMEFLVSGDGVIAGSLYASGGVGRMDVGDVIRLIRGRDERANR